MQSEFDSIPPEVPESRGSVLETEFGRKIFAHPSWWTDDGLDCGSSNPFGDAKTSDMNLMVRAMTERWPITQEKREEMILAAQEVMRLSKSPRTKLAAMKVLLMADALNVRTDTGGNHLHLHNEQPIVDTKDIAKKLMMDPKYISFLRQLDTEPKVLNDASDVDFNEITREAEQDGNLRALERASGERTDEPNPVQEREEGSQGIDGPAGRGDDAA